MTGAAAIVVLQARMGSTRLPGKVMARLDGVSLLGHAIRRLQAGDAGPVVVATSTAPEDDVVSAEAVRFGAGVYRGDPLDVLGRYAGAVASWLGPFVIRATADNPAVDPGAAPRVLQHLAAGADYVVEAGLPVGAAVEGVRTSVLRAAAAEAREPYEREHVTPFVKTRPDRFRLLVPDAPAGLLRPDLRFTVDTPDDLAYMRELASELGAGRRVVPLADYIAAADRCGQEVAGR